MLSEKVTEKDKYHMISLICGIYTTKQMDKQNKTVTDLEIQETIWQLPGCGGVEKQEKGREYQEIQTPSYKISKS